MRRSREVKETRDREAPQKVAAQLGSQTIQVKARAGEGGKLFGSVTSADVADAVLAQTGIELDRRKVVLDEPIRELGDARGAGAPAGRGRGRGRGGGRRGVAGERRSSAAEPRAPHVVASRDKILRDHGVSVVSLRVHNAPVRHRGWGVHAAARSRVDTPGVRRGGGPARRRRVGAVRWRRGAEWRQPRRPARRGPGCDRPERCGQDDAVRRALGHPAPGLRADPLSRRGRDPAQPHLAVASAASAGPSSASRCSDGSPWRRTCSSRSNGVAVAVDSSVTSSRCRPVAGGSGTGAGRPTTCSSCADWVTCVRNRRESCRSAVPAWWRWRGRSSTSRVCCSSTNRPRASRSRSPAASGSRCRRVCRERSCAVLLVEHDVGFVMEQCDTIVVLNLGEIIAVGSPEEVREDAAVQEAYLG